MKKKHQKNMYSKRRLPKIKRSKNCNYLYGKNSIVERLKYNPASIRKIYYQNSFTMPYIENMVSHHGIPSERVSEFDLTRIKKADRLQGIVAEVSAFSYASFETLLDTAVEDNTVLLCLDSITDPHNLGSIIRVAACFGGFAICLPRHSSCEVNDTVMHVASGGENFVPIAIVNNLATALLTVKERGIKVAGTVVEDATDVRQTRLDFPLCVVFGSEGKGIRPGIRKVLDERLTIAMTGAKLSFNVATAGALFCYEIDRQRQ